LSKKIVEVDGDYHFTKEQILLDKERTSVLNELGYKVILSERRSDRFNSEILDTIRERVKSQADFFIRSYKKSRADTESC
jgi:very-short-patch-repair endonuclease